MVAASRLHFRGTADRLGTIHGIIRSIPLHLHAHHRVLHLLLCAGRLLSAECTKVVCTKFIYQMFYTPASCSVNVRTSLTLTSFSSQARVGNLAKKTHADTR